MSGTLLYKTEAGVEFMFEPQVLAHFEKHKQSTLLRCEAGGQLFADLSDPATVRIMAATGPRKSDKRTIFGYRPDRAAERREIDRFYKRGLHFVGDWHTHRQKHPAPSTTDTKTMRNIVRASDHDLLGYLLVVVGTAKFPYGLFVAFHTREDWDELMLAPASSDENTERGRGVASDVAKAPTDG